MKIFIYGLLSTSIPSHSFIYRIDVLQALNHNQYVLCLSDFHDKRHSATRPQQEYLENLLNTLTKKNAYVLVEDLSSPNTATGLAGCGNFSVDSRGGILGGLSTKCKQKKIPVDNVEYRFCRVAAFGPVLNNPNRPPSSLESANKINIDAIRTEIQQAIGLVQLFKDGPNLEKYYNQNTDLILSELTRLNLNNRSHVNIANYLAPQTTPTMRSDTLKRLLTFDSGLLDISFVHKVLQAHDKNIILIVAGGAHIEKVCEVLEKNGYKRIHSTPTSYVQEHNLTGCIGSRIIDENYCIKPQAVDLHELDQFIQ